MPSDRSTKRARDAVVADLIAAAFHFAYEDLAPEFGYATREASRKPWGEVPEQNRDLMRAVVQRLIDGGVITPGSRP